MKRNGGATLGQPIDRDGYAPKGVIAVGYQGVVPKKLD
jgi:hypothetical protein